MCRRRGGPRAAGDARQLRASVLRRRRPLDRAGWLIASTAAVYAVGHWRARTAARGAAVLACGERPERATRWRPQPGLTRPHPRVDVHAPTTRRRAGHRHATAGTSSVSTSTAPVTRSRGRSSTSRPRPRRARRGVRQAQPSGRPRSTRSAVVRAARDPRVRQLARSSSDAARSRRRERPRARRCARSAPAGAADRQRTRPGTRRAVDLQWPEQRWSSSRRPDTLAAAYRGPRPRRDDAAASAIGGSCASGRKLTAPWRSSIQRRHRRPHRLVLLDLADRARRSGGRGAQSIRRRRERRRRALSETPGSALPTPRAAATST